jgi:hypothetical protein
MEADKLEKPDFLVSGPEYPNIRMKCQMIIVFALVRRRGELRFCADG